MSRGYDYDERDSHEPEIPSDRTLPLQGRGGGSPAEKPKHSRRPLGTSPKTRAADSKSRERSEVRYARQTYFWSDL